MGMNKHVGLICNTIVKYKVIYVLVRKRGAPKLYLADNLLY